MKVIFILIAAALTLGRPAAQPAVDVAPSHPTISPVVPAPIKPVSCDCTSYPFKPNPPCFGSCVSKLAEAQNPDLKFVKGLDPGVAVSIKVLAATPNKAAIDFANLKGKPDLESAAEKAFQGKDLKLEPTLKQLQLQR